MTAIDNKGNYGNRVDSKEMMKNQEAHAGVRGYSAGTGYCLKGNSYNPVPGIINSYDAWTRRIETPSPRSRRIKYGDRLFARVEMRGRTVVEFMVARVNDLTELLGELRRHARGLSGLAKLYVRNISRGWSMERPLMFYSDVQPGGGFSGREYSQSRPTPAPAAPRAMAFPWETH